MTLKSNIFQPGAALHDAIKGAFISAGTSFEDWCREAAVNASTAKNATFGQSSGNRGIALRERIIDAAGLFFP